MIPYQEIMGTQPLSVLELVFTHGFLIMFLILWSPLITVGASYSIIKYIKKKKQECINKKELLAKRLKDVC